MPIDLQSLPNDNIQFLAENPLPRISVTRFGFGTHIESFQHCQWLTQILASSYLIFFLHGTFSLLVVLKHTFLYTIFPNSIVRGTYPSSSQSLVLIIFDPTVSSYLIIVPNDQLPGSCLRKLSFKLICSICSNNANFPTIVESSQGS